MTGLDVPDEAYVVALLGLTELWPARLAALLGIGRGDGCDAGPARHPAQAWQMVRSGRAATVPRLAALLGGAGPAGAAAARWSEEARAADPARAWEPYAAAGVQVAVLGSPGYPRRLAADRAAPYVVFQVGPEPIDGAPAVAIVGTRRCTPAGADIAGEFARTLAAAGVRVISGLALGVDGAAHAGALEGGARPIGVVAGGVDRPYPARHGRLWRQVAEVGTLVSEWPLGMRSEGWRFPARNRIIAALSDAVVVVESRESGGSMITADEALSRGVPVLAVPGSIRSAASAGANKLLCDGAHPATSVDDVLSLLGLAVPPRRIAPSRPMPSGLAATVLGAVGWEPTPLNRLLTRTGIEPSALAAALAHLEIDGWVHGGAGGWQRRAE